MSDENPYNAMEEIARKITSIPSALGIFIIRKVLGATVWQVIALSCKEFLGLIAISFVIAVPVSYLMMHRWLTAFAY